MTPIKFYIVATPIGNLSDITLRALEIFKDADLILSEDTRKTKILLDKYEIQKPLQSYHQQSSQKQVEKIIEKISQQKNVALVSEAGVPGISDPGNKLIEQLSDSLSGEIQFIPIPGACALTALASVAGINMNKFSFFGFPPNKKGRRKFFQNVLKQELPVIYYESPYRLIKNLQLLEELTQDSQVSIKLIIGKELTKIHENIQKGNLPEILNYFQANPKKIRGEFTVIIYK